MLTVMQSLSCGTAGYLSGTGENLGILGCVVRYLPTFRRTQFGKQIEMDSLNNTHFKPTNTRICSYLSVSYSSSFPHLMLCGS
jgi:hypothetical protein